MAKSLIRFLLVSLFLVPLSARNVQADSIGYIGPSSSNAPSSNSTPTASSVPSAPAKPVKPQAPAPSLNNAVQSSGTISNSTTNSTTSSSSSSDSTSTPIDPKKVHMRPMAAFGGLNGTETAPANLQSSSVEVEPSTGSASMSIPITVPAGRGGIQPELSLVYSSENHTLGNAGVGWSLDLGSIQHSTKNGLQTYGGPKDIFTLSENGSETDMVADPTTPNLYHMEVEGAFAQIQYIPGLDYWLITDKKGTKYYYGNTADSKQVDMQAVPTFKWCLNRVEDINGNYMTISYMADQNQIYPQYINYTGNDQTNAAPFAQVQIYYAQATAPSTSYISAMQVTTAQRIDHITVAAEANVQSTYQLTYKTSNYTSRDLLSSVQQLDINGSSSSIPPVTFSYSSDGGTKGFKIDTSYILSSISNNFGSFAYQVNQTWLDFGDRVLDLNGDGYPDIGRFASVQGGANVNIAALNTKQKSWGTPVNSVFYMEPLNDFNPGYGFDIYSEDYNYPYSYYTGLEIVDLNGDGLPDLVQYYQGSSSNIEYAAVNNGNSNPSLAFSTDNNWDLPADACINAAIAGGEGSCGVEFGSLWGSGYPDIFVASVDSNSHIHNDAYQNKLSQNGTEGWAQTNSNEFPPDWVDFTKNAALVDLNGDGLSDIITNVNGSCEVYMNTGTGWQLQTNSGYCSGNVAQYLNFAKGNVQFIDLLGDGLPDMVVADGNSADTHTYINTGNGFVQDDNWALIGSDGSVGEFDNYGTVMIDPNATGLPGYMRNYSNGGPVMYANQGQTADLLTGVNNGIGAQTTINYNSIFHYNNTFMPFYMPVVSSVTTTVANPIGAASSYTTRYNYGGAHWDKVNREFDGFYWEEAFDPYNNFVLTYFKQDHWLKGHAFETLAYDSNGNLYSKSINTWSTQPIVQNTQAGSTLPPEISNFVYLSRTDNYLYDGNNAATPMRTAQAFTYADVLPSTYPNQDWELIKTINYGQVNATTGAAMDPNETVTYTNYVNNTAAWILGLPYHVYTEDIHSNILGQTYFYYDGSNNVTATPTLGHLTSKVNWLGISGKTDPKTSYTYDGYGNLLATTDPNGNVTSITYDTDVHLFPVQTKNAMGQTTISSYYGVAGVPLNNGAGFQGLWGQAKSTTDANNKTAYSVYDSLGRPKLSISPLDSVTLPTTTKSYALNSNYTQVTSQSRISGSLGSTLESVEYYDGLGRLIETKSPGPTLPICPPVGSCHPGNYIVSGQTSYDFRGLPVIKYLPFLTTNNFNTIDPINTSNPAATITYDAMGRATTQINPDGTHSSIVYNQWTTTTTDENGHEQVSTVDAFGRLVQKQEFTGSDGRDAAVYPASSFSVYATTTYAYNPAGDLVKVTDAQNNVTTVNYDNLGRKISMTDPDMGTWSYGYDNNGNLVSQTDAKAKTITFTYDTLNRLKNKNDAVVGGPAATFNVNYTYDQTSQAYGIGRLGAVAYSQTGTSSGQAGFVYDQIGRESTSTKTIASTNYNVLRQYDDLNRLTQVQYPDNSQLTYTYNEAGEPYSVYATGTTNYYVKSVAYNANNQITQINYGNGDVTTYSYYPQNFRLEEMITTSTNTSNPKLQDLFYTYDAAGQIVSIADKVNAGTPNDMSATYAYDEQNRLISAHGNYGSKTYSYNQIGNIISKDGLNYTYGGVGTRTGGGAAGPHAVTSLSDGTTFKYDLNGNMTTLSKGTETTFYNYDTQNRLCSVYSQTTGGALTAIAYYTYDGDGGRTQKVVYRRDKGVYHIASNSSLLFNDYTPTQWPATAANLTVDYTTYVGNLYESENEGTDGKIRASKFVFLGSTKIASINYDGTVFYYHGDHLGGTNVVTDNTGVMRELTETDPFGTITVHEKYGSNYGTVWYYFTGKPLDDETGLTFLGARYYNSALGRFITPDTMVPGAGNPQNLNRYSYCGNNPVNFTDPTGHKKHSWWHWFSRIFEGIGIAIAGVVLFAASGGLASALGPMLEGILQGTIAGTAVGGFSSAVTGGDIGQGLLTGAISGAIFGAIGGFHLAGLAQEAAHAAGGAASGAIDAEITHGNVGLGALTGGASAGASQWASDNIKFFNLTGNYMHDVVRQAALGAIVGGGTSAAFGGSFLRGAENGAEMSAIGYTSNYYTHTQAVIAADWLLNTVCAIVPGLEEVAVVRVTLETLDVGAMLAKGNNSNDNKVYKDAVRDAGLNSEQEREFSQLYHFQKNQSGRGGDDNLGYWDIRQAAEDYLSKRGK